MSLEPFHGPGSTPSRRRFWNEARNAVLALRKKAGRNVTVDEHPGKGSVINVDESARTRKQQPSPTFAGNLPTLYCDFRSVHLLKANTFPPLLGVGPAQCIGQYLTRTASLNWSAAYHADDYPSVGLSLDITHTTSGTETATLDTDGNIVSVSRGGSTSVTRSDGNHTCSGTLVNDSATNVCTPFYQTLYPASWYQSYFQGTQQNPPNPAFSLSNCVGCTGGGGVVPNISCTGPDTVNNSYYGTHHTGICGGNFYEGWQNGTCQKSDNGTVGFPASGGSWSWSWDWTVEHSDEYTTAMFIQKARDALAAQGYQGNWRCRLSAFECREPDFPCTYAPYDATDACGCWGYTTLSNDALTIDAAQFRYYLRVNDSDPVPSAGTTLLWDEETTFDDTIVIDAPMSFSFNGTSRETDIFETPIQDENSTTIIVNVRWQ
jgi:hypothetical protein